ncbi:MAG TPA: TolC family protein [Pirellulales bacterium]
MSRLNFQLGLDALALCAFGVWCSGCAAPYPSVPRQMLAERILQPEQPGAHWQMPPGESITTPSAIGNQSPPNNRSDAPSQPSEIPTPLNFNPPGSDQANPARDGAGAPNNSSALGGRRLNISQSSALKAPLDPPQAITAEYSTVGDSIDLHSTANADKLTLATAIDLAYRNNPALAAARAKIDMAQAGKDITYADFLPVVGTGFRHISGDTRPSGFSLPTVAQSTGNVAYGGTAEEFDVAELRAQMTLWDFGRTASRYGQSLVTKEIAGLQYVRSQQTVAFDVASAYFDALSAKAATDVAEESVRRAQSALDDAKNYFHRGNAIRNDVLKANVFLKQMQLELVKAHTASGVAIAKLNRAIGINPSCETQLAELAEAPRFEQSLGESLQLAVENRREFGVVERGIAKAKLGQSEAEAEFRPKITVGALGSVEQEHDPTRYAEHASAGIGIELGLYQGGRRVAELHQSHAEIDLAVASGKQVCDQIAYEVKVAYLSLTDAAERIKVSQAEVAQASENIRVVKSLFDRGDAIPTEVIEAELTLTHAQQGNLIATYDYETALSRLAFAVGLPPESFLGLPRR